MYEHDTFPADDSASQCACAQDIIVLFTFVDVNAAHSSFGSHPPTPCSLGFCSFATDIIHMVPARWFFATLVLASWLSLMSRLGFDFWATWLRHSCAAWLLPILYGMVVVFGPYVSLQLAACLSVAAHHLSLWDLRCFQLVALDAVAALR